jgi:F0F1-type ATP synthase alpha subunit
VTGKLARQLLLLMQSSTKKVLVLNAYVAMSKTIKPLLTFVKKLEEHGALDHTIIVSASAI